MSVQLDQTVSNIWAKVVMHFNDLDLVLIGHTFDFNYDCLSRQLQNIKSCTTTGIY